MEDARQINDRRDTKASKRALCDGTGGLLAGDNYGAVSGRIG